MKLLESFGMTRIERIKKASTIGIIVSALIILIATGGYVLYKKGKISF